MQAGSSLVDGPGSRYSTKPWPDQARTSVTRLQPVG